MNDECLRIADQLHRAFNGEAWHRPSLQELLRQVKAQELETVIKTFDEARLRNTVPGRDYNFYFLFHGVVQHSLYHAGQIALLKKMTVGG